MDELEFKARMKKMEIEPSGPFYSYSLNFDKTITPKRYLGLFFNRLLEIVGDFFPDKKLKKLRILDLGSYEGAYSIPFAQLGAEVVSVEGKEINFRKLQFARDFLKLKNLTPVLADVRTITEKKFGRFDLVLSCGLMYHLDAPSVFEVAENIFTMTNRAAIFDTHFALSRPLTYEYKGSVYHGRSHKEFDPGTLVSTKNLLLAHALDNNESFWLTKISWLNLLKNIGFDTAHETLMPFVENELGGYDRFTLIATRHPRSEFTFKEESPILHEQIGEVVPISQDDVSSNSQNLIIR